MTSERPSRWNARLALLLACAWVAAGALFKLFTGSPSDLPATIREFPLLKPEWTFKLAIGIELSIVILALARPRVGWLLLAALYVVFDLLLWQILRAGEASCGCFGSKVPLKPAHMLAIDSVLLVSLLASRVWSAFEKRPLRPLPLLPLFALVIAAPWYKFRDTRVVQVVDQETGAVETQVVQGDWYSFEPSKWEGALLADTDLAGFLSGGQDQVWSIPAPAHVILYRNSCDHCRQHFEGLLADPVVDRPLVLIRIPDDAGSEDVVAPVKPADAVEYELQVLPRGYGITTPVAFDLDDAWTVHGVVERPE